MFLKYRYRLGFEPLCREVADSITWSAVLLGSRSVGEVPHPTTLMKITTRCGDAGDQRTERGAVGQGGRGEGAQDEPGAGGHDGGRGERGVSVGLVAARQGRQPDGIHGARSCRASRLRDPHPRCVDRTRSVSSPGAVDQREHCVAAATTSSPKSRGSTASSLASPEPRSHATPTGWSRNARRRLRAESAKTRDGRVRAIVDRLEQLAQRLDEVADQPANGSPAPPPTVRPASCRCMTPTPGRSPKDGSASPSSSATRHRSSTTKTA